MLKVYDIGLLELNVRGVYNECDLVTVSFRQ